MIVKGNLVFCRRINAQPRSGRCMGVQSVGEPDLRELAHPGRPGIENAASLPSATGFLSQHLRPRQDPAASIWRRWRRSGRRFHRLRPRRLQLRPHQLRQGLGTQVFAAGSHFLSVLARSAPSAVQVIIPKADRAEKHRQVSSSTRASCSSSPSSLPLFSGRIGDNDTATVAFSSVLARAVLIINK